MSTSQKGFGLVPVLLVLILVSLIGLTGYYVWNTQKHNSSSKVISTNQTQDAKDTATTKAFLVIKEWGVKIPVDTTQSGGLIYSTGKSDNGSDYAKLSSNDVIKSDASCDSIYLLNRSATELDLSEIPAPTYLAKIGQYYYYGSAANGVCSSSQGITEKQSEELTAVQGPVRTLYINAAPKIIAQ